MHERTALKDGSGFLLWVSVRKELKEPLDNFGVIGFLHFWPCQTAVNRVVCPQLELAVGQGLMWQSSDLCMAADTRRNGDPVLRGQVIGTLCF